jgi:carbon-monoxide dehydrogenase large subunit
VTTADRRPATLVGARVARVEDERFLTGRGRFVDDLRRPGMLHAAILRSTSAHATIRGVDASALGSDAWFLGPDRLRERAPGPIPVIWTLPLQRQSGHALVEDRVRYAGEPIGIVVAGSRAEAEDGLERILVHTEELPAVPDPEAALVQDAPPLYPEWGTNVAAGFDSGDGAAHTEAVFASADRVLGLRQRRGRVSGTPMEGRALLADPTDGRLTVWTSTQSPHMVRDVIASVLGLAHRRIRVIGPDVGGAFGLKDHIYEDELMVCIAALELGRPVKWIEDRMEGLLSTTQARGEVFDVEVAFDLDGRLRGLRARGLRDAGAHLSIFGGGPLRNTADNLPGPYRWDAVRFEGTVVVTNRPPTGAYRGFGQPQATLLRERAVDRVASELGIDPVELRRRNMIGPQEMPYRTRTLLTYETGDYPGSLERAAGIVAGWPEPPDDGLARGTGYASYVELAAIGPRDGARVLGVDASTYETATVEMELDGSVRVIVGTSPHGQGHETTFAQLVADRLGVPMEWIRSVHSDTDITPYSSYGTAASRSMAVGGGAIVRAADRLADKIRRVAGELLEADPADIELAGGRATVGGTDVSIPLMEIATTAIRAHRLPDGVAPGLSETVIHDPVGLTFSYATHACSVAVDRRTGEIAVERYAVVHDCGTVVNPMIVEGQIHGGVAQGVGEALLEGLGFDANAQPLSTTFMDYLLPLATSLPDIHIVHTVHPSPTVPGGMKGMGEGGTIGAPAAVLGAVAAAVPEIADRIEETPITPAVLRALLRGAEA